MSKKFNTVQLSKQELAAQLKMPKGKEGKKIGEEMNKGNKYICLNTYKILDPKPNKLILEIGMGNGFFVKDLLKMAKDITYIGVDFSDVMVEEATKINQEFTNTKQASFLTASVDKLPIKDASIDYITTTNTIYFWPNLKNSLQELCRVLKPNGKLVIGYRSKELMEQIELTKYGFDKFLTSEIEDILQKSGFKHIITETIPEPDLDFDGVPLTMEGCYSVGIKK